MLRMHRVVLAGLAVLLAAGCAAAQDEPEIVWVPLGGETFSLELALEGEMRHRGLSGRPVIPRRGGMLFVLPRPQEFTMVMRGCPVAIDVAFLDARGNVVEIHEMRPEAPRRPDETPLGYESRLRAYSSRVPVQFAIEVGGGRLREVGMRKGDKISLDLAGLTRRAR